MSGFDFQQFLDFVSSPLLFAAAWVTIWVATAAQAIGVGIGLVAGPMLLSPRRFVRAIAWFYLWVFKGTPLLAQILFFYAALPQLGVKLGLVATGLLALGINEGARMAEIIRAGLMSVPKEQREAALSLGLKPWQVFIKVVFPQAFRLIVPPLGNNFSYMIKATSLLATISFAELLRVSQQLAQSTTRPLEVYLAASVWYLLLITLWTLIQKRIERGVALKQRNDGGSPAVHDEATTTARMPVAAVVDVEGKARDGGVPRGSEQAREVVIEARGVSRKFGSTQALDRADLTVHRGEIVVILGPSGSGKSTLLRTLNWIEPPDSGEVFIEGESIPKREDGRRRSERGIDAMRRRMGMVFQSFALFPTYTARENVALGLRKLAGLDRASAHARADKLLTSVGLGDRVESFPVELSGGQRQRVAIARALAMDPVALLFDEPTSALDAETVHEVLKVMTDLAKQGVTMVVVTHEVGFARAMADRLVFMEDGRIVMDAPIDEAFSKASPARFREFLSQVG